MRPEPDIPLARGSKRTRALRRRRAIGDRQIERFRRENGDGVWGGVIRLAVHRERVRFVGVGVVLVRGEIAGRGEACCERGDAADGTCGVPPREDGGDRAGDFAERAGMRGRRVELRGHRVVCCLIGAQMVGGGEVGGFDCV